MSDEQFIQFMTASYASAALRHARDDRGPLLGRFGLTDIDFATWTRMRAACETFYREHKNLLGTVKPANVGLDLFAARNGMPDDFGHAVYAEDGDALRRAARLLGPTDPLRADPDGLVH